MLSAAFDTPPITILVPMVPTVPNGPNMAPVTAPTNDSRSAATPYSLKLLTSPRAISDIATPATAAVPANAAPATIAPTTTAPAPSVTAVKAAAAATAATTARPPSTLSASFFQLNGGFGSGSVTVGASS
ncbi:hypothetical protein D3C80_1739020 [compost metagenome]